MIKNALFCLSLLCVSLYGAVEYDVVLLAPKGEELTTESPNWWEDSVKINNAGYVIGTYRSQGLENSMSYIYHQKFGFKTIRFPNNETLHKDDYCYYEGVKSVNNQGIAVGVYGNNDMYHSSSYYYNTLNDPKVFIFDAKTEECYDLLEAFGLNEAEGFSLRNSFVKQIYITDENRVILDCDNSNTYIYDLKLKAVSLLKNGELIAVNQTGQMIGDSWFYDPKSGVQELGSLDQFNRWQVNPQAISPNGVVAGFGNDSYGERMGFLWSSDHGLLPFDISGDYPDIVGVNDNGQVLGQFELDGDDDYYIHAFFYSHEEGFLDIGTLGGYECRPRAINNQTQVVGMSSTSRYDQERAFIWSFDHGMRDLTKLIPQKSGWKVLEEASGINDSGCIVGYGKYFGVDHHFLLVPKK